MKISGVPSPRKRRTMGQRILFLCVFLVYAFGKGTADLVVSLQSKGIYNPPICNVTLSCFIKHTNVSPNALWPYRKEIPSKPPWLCLGCHGGITEEAGFHSQVFRRYGNTSLTLHTLTVTKCYRRIIKIACYAAPNSLKDIQLGSGYFNRLPSLRKEGFYIWPRCNVTLVYTVRGFWSDFVWTCRGCPYNPSSRVAKVPGFHVTTNSSFLSSSSSLTITSCYRSIVVGCRINPLSVDEFSERTIMLSLDKEGCSHDSNCGYLKNGVCSGGRCEYEVPSSWGSRTAWIIVGLVLGTLAILYGSAKAILKRRRK